VLFGGGCVGESAASQIVCLLFGILTIAIFARAILSWFNLDPRSPLIQVLDSITEPILEPIRRIMPRLGMIDLSPLIAILLLTFVSQALQRNVFG
jgi:YggT family protein